MANVVRPSAEQAAQLAQGARALEDLVRGPVSDTCGAFYVTWRALRSQRAMFSAQLRAECTTLAKQIETLARVTAGLSAGQLRLQYWKSGPQGELRMGVLPADASGMGWIVPLVIAVGVGVAAFILADLYLTARNTEAQAALKRAEILQAAQHAIATAPADQRDAMASALAKAAKAMELIAPDWLTSLGTTLGGALTKAGNAAASTLSKLLSSAAFPWLVIGFALWMGGRRR